MKVTEKDLKSLLHTEEGEGDHHKDGGRKVTSKAAVRVLLQLRVPTAIFTRICTIQLRYNHTCCILAHSSSGVSICTFVLVKQGS